MLRDALLLSADLDEAVGKTFREPTPAEFAAADAAEKALAEQVPFGRGLPAVPDELIPAANTWTVRPLSMVRRPTATFVTLVRHWASWSSHARSAV